jgi:hypothetical protein
VPQLQATIMLTRPQRTQQKRAAEVNSAMIDFLRALYVGKPSVTEK